MIQIDKAPSIFKGLRDGGSIRLFENIGIGTGVCRSSQTLSSKIKKYFKNIFSSSNESTELLENLQFEVSQGAPENVTLDFYVDGADEVDKNKNLIKGGGGAHTKRKNSRKASKKCLSVLLIFKKVEMN